MSPRYHYLPKLLPSIIDKSWFLDNIYIICVQKNFGLQQICMIGNAELPSQIQWEEQTHELLLDATQAVATETTGS